MLKVAIPKKSENKLTIYQLSKNKKCFDCASGKIPCFVVTKLWTFVCSNCAPLLLEMNLICKSITTGTFSEKELLSIQNRDHSDLELIFMKGYSKDEQLRFPIPNGNNPNYTRSFLYEKYYKRRWFVNQEGNQANSETTAQKKAQPLKTNEFLFEDEFDEGDVKTFNNPNQFRRFGDYQNVHLASSPDVAEPVEHIMEIKKSVSYSISVPVHHAPSSKNVTEGSKKSETKADPYAAFKSDEVNTPSLFAKFEEQRKNDEANDPYAAFRYTSPSAKSVFDAPSNSVFCTTTSSTSFFPSQQVVTPISEDDDFGEFMGATMLVPQNPVSSTSSSSKDNLLNADFSDLLKF